MLNLGTKWVLGDAVLNTRRAACVEIQVLALYKIAWVRCRCSVVSIPGRSGNIGIPKGLKGSSLLTALNYLLNSAAVWA